MRRLKLLIVLLLTAVGSSMAAPKEYQNPILKGFYPDPSICRVGEDYYMVNSSFEWYPAVPIFHSRDLVNWEQLGYVLDRPSQLTIKQGMRASAGVWAPTIRYIKGRYYVIVTAKQCGNTFYVSCDDPQKGEWSDPTYLRDAPGIDPSLFCDDDGTVWICANDRYKTSEMAQGQTSNEFIWLQQLDLKRGKLYGERYRLPHGLTLNSPATEAPHIYKVNGKYYLITAEGMTWNNHAVAMFKSDKITGPYVACNGGKPLLTHRTLPNAGGAITTTGHADLVQTPSGEWWAMLLAVRPIDGMNLLGRETFICPANYDGDEFHFGDNEGRVVMSGARPDLKWSPTKADSPRDNFSGDRLSLKWNFLRTPPTTFHKVSDGKLELKLLPQRVDSLVTPSLVARRVEDHNFTASTQMSFSPRTTNEEAGIVIMQNSTNFYTLTLTKDKRVKLIKSDRRSNGIYEVTESEVINNPKELILGVEGRDLEYRFFYSQPKKHGERIYIGGVQDATVCASNRAGGFTGSYVGLYCTSSGESSNNIASYDWFEYLAQ